MHVYVCIRMHVFVFVRTCFAHVCAYVYVPTKVRTGLCTSMYLHKHVFTQACIYTSMYLHKHVFTQACIYTSMYLHKHVFTQACVNVRVFGCIFAPWEHIILDECGLEDM